MLQGKEKIERYISATDNLSFSKEYTFPTISPADEWFAEVHGGQVPNHV